MITINKPMNLVLEPNELAVVLDALAERPYKVAQPVMEKIVAQVRMQSEVPRDQENSGASNVADSGNGDAGRSNRSRGIEGV